MLMHAHGLRSRIFAGIGLLVSGLALVASPVAAQTTDRTFYVTVGTGAIFPSSPTAVVPGLFPPASITYNVDTGYDISAAAGYRFGRLRVEGEFTYLRSNVSGVTANVVGSGSATARALGRFENYALMANVYYDFPTGSLVTPYLGAGIGYNSFAANNLLIPDLGLSLQNTSQGTFAYQARAGLAFRLAQDFEVLLGYRYFGTTAINTPVIGSIGNQSINNVELGLRFGL